MEAYIFIIIAALGSQLIPQLLGLVCCCCCIYACSRKVVKDFQEKGENIKKNFVEGLNLQGNSQQHIQPVQCIAYRKRTIVKQHQSDILWSVTKDFRSKYEFEFMPGGAIQGTCEYSDNTKKNLQGYYTVSNSNINCTWIEGIDLNNQDEPQKFLTMKNLQKMKQGDNVLFGNVRGELQFDAENGTKFCENFSGKYETPNSTSSMISNLSRVEDELKLQPFIIKRDRMDTIMVALFEFNADFIQNTNRASQKYSYPYNYTFIMKEDINALASTYTIKFDANGQLNGSCYNEREGKLHIFGYYTSSTTETYCTWIQSNKQIDINLFLHNFRAGLIQQVVQDSTIFEIVSLKRKIHSLIKRFFVGKVFFGTRWCSRGDPDDTLKLKVLRENKH